MVLSVVQKCTYSYKKRIHADFYVIVMKCPVKSKRKLSIYNTGVRVCVGNIFLGSDLWLAICFKIMTRYTCLLYLQSSALWVIFQVCAHFLLMRLFPQKRTLNKHPYICVTNKHVYMGS